jgi:hypothetical protein
LLPADVWTFLSRGGCWDERGDDSQRVALYPNGAPFLPPDLWTKCPEAPERPLSMRARLLSSSSPPAYGCLIRNCYGPIKGRRFGLRVCQYRSICLRNCYAPATAWRSLMGGFEDGRLAILLWLVCDGEAA